MAKSKLINVFRNDRGFADADPLDVNDKRAAYLASTIAGGIQAYLDDTENALKKIDAVKCGDLEEFVTGGNDLELTVTRKGVVFEHHVFPDDPPLHYTIDEVRDALEDWRDLLRAPRD